MFNPLFKKLIFAGLFISGSAISGVEIGGTRLIYDSKSSQASISVNNPDSKPYLVQSWVSKSDQHDDNDSTFITTPPLFRLEPGTQNSVRVVLNEKGLPKDRESIYWLNIKSIPTSSPDAKNDLLIAVKSKMKLIYRPAELKGDPSLAYQQLQFSSKNGKLMVKNPTPFTVSLFDVKINGKAIEKPTMVLPYQDVPLANPASVGSEIIWRAINDFGGITKEHKSKTQA
ncbi:fimbrial biogenesis chaperone [Serratia sp. L9]|uniref:fimbrial biogenesis chaperone n=1 Tax=Serratia sp. L9 TaxID=3423946 RepID=UPI003D66642D